MFELTMPTCITLHFLRFFILMAEFLVSMRNGFCQQICGGWMYKQQENVTGPPGALLFDVKPEIALK